MSLGRPLLRAYLVGLAVALPLGALVPALISLALLLSNPYYWNAPSASATVMSATAGSAAVGLIVAACAAAAGTFALLLVTRTRSLSRGARVTAVTLGAAAGTVIFGIVSFMVTHDSISFTLTPFLVIPSALFAAVIAAAVEKRAARTQESTS